MKTETIPTENQFHQDQLKLICEGCGFKMSLAGDGTKVHEQKAHILFQESEIKMVNELQSRLDIHGYDYIVRQNAFGPGHYIIIDVDKNDMSRRDIDEQIESITFVIDHLGNVSQKHVDFQIHPMVEMELQRRWDLLLKKAKNINQ